MATAKIGPTGYNNTFGILWRDFLLMEQRGGYSGPFETLQEAEKRAREICLFYEEPVNIELVDTLNTK